MKTLAKWERGCVFKSKTRFHKRRNAQVVAPRNPGQTLYELLMQRMCVEIPLELDKPPLYQKFRDYCPVWEMDPILRIKVIVNNRTFEQDQRGCDRYVEKYGCFVRVWIGDGEVTDWQHKHPFGKTLEYQELEKEIQDNKLFRLKYTRPLSNQIRDFIQDLVDIPKTKLRIRQHFGGIDSEVATSDHEEETSEDEERQNYVLYQLVYIAQSQRDNPAKQSVCGNEKYRAGDDREKRVITCLESMPSTESEVNEEMDHLIQLGWTKTATGLRQPVVG